MLLSLLLLWGPASAGGRVFFEDWPLNDAIPHLKTVEGFDFGERVALHREVIAYAKVLANASPRVSYQAHGSTWEGREMGLLFISSEKNINQLNQLLLHKHNLKFCHKAEENAK